MAVCNAYYTVKTEDGGMYSSNTVKPDCAQQQLTVTKLEKTQDQWWLGGRPERNLRPSVPSIIRPLFALLDCSLCLQHKQTAEPKLSTHIWLSKGHNTERCRLEFATLRQVLHMRAADDQGAATNRSPVALGSKAL